MNYRETPIGEEPAREIPLKEYLAEIEKKLAETDACLRSIIELINGEPARREEKAPEAQNMVDQLEIVSDLSDSCMALSHRIHEIMF